MNWRHTVWLIRKGYESNQCRSQQMRQVDRGGKVGVYF